MSLDLRYSLLMLAAIGLMSLLLRRSQTRLPLFWWQKLGIGVGGFCGAMLGSKLPFFMADWENLDGGLTWFADGKTIMFGIVGGYLGVELAKWTLEVRVRTGDTFAAPVALAVALGRLACYVGGCCFGQPTSLPWGVVFPSSGTLEPRHPTQLYEFAFHLSMAALLWEFKRRGWFKDQLAKLYILTYLVFRFVTEFLRPEQQLALGLTAYQWAALALMPVFVGLWIGTARQVQRESQIDTATSP
jgi:phosphatidylglycerol:prolipoprotein diacylglycerol transferase